MPERVTMVRRQRMMVDAKRMNRLRRRWTRMIRQYCEEPKDQRDREYRLFQMIERAQQRGHIFAKIIT